MKKTKFKPPYKTEKGKRRATFSRQKFDRAGVYLIKDRNGKIVYVGHSQTSVYDTMYRHFQSWNDNQRRVTYPKTGYTVRVVTTTPKQAVNLESLLIQKHKPKDNKYKLFLLTKFEIKQTEESYKLAEIIPEGVDIGF